MQFSINSNPSATSASHNLSKAMDAHRRSLARLSSGNRIVNPADDAGGLAVGNKLDSKLSRLEKVHQNLKNTISFTELQESALRTVGVIITRMSELKTMSTDVTKNSADIENYNKEFVELQKQIEAMTKHKFNGVSLFSNTSKFAETDADGRSGHGVDLARNFVFDEYVAQSGAVLGQGTTTTTSARGTADSGNTYTIDQWRADYDQWINYDDSNWDNDFLTWMANPEPYGGVAILNEIKNAREAGSNSLDLNLTENFMDLTPLAGLQNLETLRLGSNPSSPSNLSDLSPLASLKNLNELLINYSNVTDISPIAGLTDLISFWQSDSPLSDLSPLANLTSIRMLGLHTNQISDISPLSNLNNLNYVELWDNNISDITPLYGSFPGHGFVDVNLNPITQSDVDAAKAELPNVDFWLFDSKPYTQQKTTTDYPLLDQFTSEDFTNFTQSVASALAEVGSHQSRLNMEVRQNESARVNLEAAKSRIMDADMAQESTRFAKTNVLVQSSASMVAQANQLSDIALRLMVNR